MKFRLSEVLAAAAGVIIFDLLFCGVVAPKIMQKLELRAQKHSGCGCTGNCGCQAKNITDRAQVIDVTPLSVN